MSLSDVRVHSPAPSSPTTVCGQQSVRTTTDRAQLTCAACLARMDRPPSSPQLQLHLPEAI